MHAMQTLQSNLFRLSMKRRSLCKIGIYSISITYGKHTHTHIPKTNTSRIRWYVQVFVRIWKFSNNERNDTMKMSKGKKKKIYQQQQQNHI